ncbi:hypothetical protein Anas_02569 [Armadillidium nasatum]|uniref:Uncharacterized protein n=1 Tax=Armadillidium nasatum TaxID=96803 RepID=A0A5N5SWZ0_9CRUS|nr:hypothetical protein Anas_02569 [Armadillidium nasatum]
MDRERRDTVVFVGGADGPEGDDEVSLQALASILKDYRPEEHDEVYEVEDDLFHNEVPNTTLKHPTPPPPPTPLTPTLPQPNLSPQQILPNLPSVYTEEIPSKVIEEYEAAADHGK